MSIVWAWRESVAEYVAAGQQVVTPLPECPGCRRRLGRWSGYWRWVRYPLDQRRIWIRRTRCRPCRASHALLPDFLFFRRLDEVATIAQVLALRVGAEGELRALARRFDLPRETLRGWWDRFRARSPTLLAELVAVAIALDAAPLDLQQKGRGGGVRSAGPAAPSRASAIRRATRRRCVALVESHQRRQGPDDQHAYALAAPMRLELDGAIAFDATRRCVWPPIHPSMLPKRWHFSDTH